jgi:two-component system, sensor histidine kinase and response regulator
VSAGLKTTLTDDKSDHPANGDVQPDSESALSKKTLQQLRKLGLDMGPSFFAKLLESFEHDAFAHVTELRSAIRGGDTGRLREEAHALKGASLTIGALCMANTCTQLESLGKANSLEGAPAALVQLEHEFDRVKIEIEQEGLTVTKP